MDLKLPPRFVTKLYFLVHNVQSIQSVTEAMINIKAPTKCSTGNVAPNLEHITPAKV